MKKINLEAVVNIRDYTMRNFMIFTLMIILLANGGIRNGMHISEKKENIKSSSKKISSEVTI